LHNGDKKLPIIIIVAVRIAATVIIMSVIRLL
jgi:hypothetical protein